MPKLVDLPADVLARVARSLLWGDWARLACVSRAFRDVVADARAACFHADASTLQLSILSEKRALNNQASFYFFYTIGWHVLRWSHGLQSLVLCGVLDIDDYQLHFFALLKQLHSLDIASTKVTSRGLRSLWSMQSLRELDITFCPIVSYGAVLDLRQQCPDLRLIRRQPRWLDGHFETPWGEIRTHYPCGAFSFSSVAESVGWTAQLVHRGDYLEDRRIFVDIDEESFEQRLMLISGRYAIPRSFRQRTAEQYNGRVGVLLQDLGGLSADERHVLVVESLFPRFFPEPPHTMPALDFHPPPGLSVEVPTPVSPAAEGYKVSTMIVTPLEPGCTQPPAHVQARLRLFCEERPVLRRKAERIALQSSMPDIVWHAFKSHSCWDEYNCFEDEEVIDALLADPPELVCFDEEEEEDAVSEQDEQ